MQAVKAENKLPRKTVQRLIIILLLGTVIMAAMNIGMPAYASERELEDGQVFNQSGRSYSGVINSTLLGQEIEITAYDNWPQGFTKGNQAFSGAVYDGEFIWMVPYRADRVIRFHPTTGEMTGYAAWPQDYDPGPDHFANGAFLGGVFDGESIWLIPYDANMVVQLNPVTGEMRGYNNWPDEVGAGYRFSGGYYDGESIILVPHNSEVLVELNLATREMEGYSDWPADLQWGANGAAFASSVYDGENIWMLPYEANQVVRFNTLTKEMTGYPNGPLGVNLSTERFIGGAYDGERIWMAPLSGGYVVAIDRTTGYMSRYEIELEDYHPFDISYNSMFFDGEAVWLIPYNQNAFMRLDPNTGEATLHGNWPEGFNKGHSSFFTSVSDAEHVWAIPFSADKVIRLSSAQASSKYAVIYDGNGATEGDVPIDAERYEEGETVTVLGNVGQLALPDHRFTGWSLSPSVTDAVYTAGDRFTMGNEDVTLYAVWEESTGEQPETYTVRYDGNGATSGHIPVGERTYNLGEQVTVEPNSGQLQRDGYSFTAWNTKPDGSGTTYAAGDQITIDGENVTLYAMWSPVAYPERPSPSTQDVVQQPSPPNQRSISIQLDSSNVAIHTSIYRIKGKNGQKVDELRINDALVQKLKEALKTEKVSSVTFMIRDAKGKLDAEEYVINITPSALRQLSSLNVQLEFDLYEMVQTLTAKQLADMAQSSRAVLLRFVPSEAAQQTTQAQSLIRSVESNTMLENGCIELISQPVIVEVNASQDENFETLLTFNLNETLMPREEKLRDAFLEALYVYVEHEDGTSSLIKGERLNERKNGYGIQIKMDMISSTFAIVRVVPETGEERYDHYINGYVDGTFQPSRPLTRAELAVLVGNFLEDSVAPSNTEAFAFRDVKQDHWAAASIQKVNQAGIMQGTGGGSFLPGQSVSRAEFATVLARWKELPAITSSTFPDVKDHWAAQAISTVHAQGWMKGFEDGTYRPNQALTRAEAVKTLNAVLKRPALQHLKQEKWSDVPSSHWAWSDIESASRTFRLEVNQDGIVTQHVE